EARDLLVEFAALRQDSIALARRLRPDQLARGGQHPKVGHLRVNDLLHEWVHHDRNHHKQILANVQAYAWPHMGNSQKFSAAGAARPGRRQLPRPSAPAAGRRFPGRQDPEADAGDRGYSRFDPGRRIRGTAGPGLAKNERRATRLPDTGGTMSELDDEVYF